MIAAIKFLTRRYFKTLTFFYTRLGYRVPLSFSFNIAVGLLDGLGLTMFLPLLQMVDNSSQVDSSQLGYLRFIIDIFQHNNIELTLGITLSLMAIFFILKGIAQYLNGMYRVRVQQYFVKRLRDSLITGITALDFRKFIQTDAGRIQNSLTGEVDRVSRAYQTYFHAFQFAVLVAVYIIFAFLVNAEFALLVSLGGGLTNFIYQYIYKITRQSSHKLTEDTHAFQSLLIQMVTNLKYLKATAMDKLFASKLHDKVVELEANNSKIGKLSSFVTAIREPIVVLMIAAIIYLQVEIMGTPFGPILVSLLFFYRALTYLMMMQTQWNLFMTVSGSLDGIADFSEELNVNREHSAGEIFYDFNHSIELKNVSVKIGEASLLNNISVMVKKNDWVTIVGESGSGKSTLVNLVAGLLSPDNGEVLIDGKNLNTYNKNSFRQKIGYMTQDAVLFNDTIFNNVTLWADRNEDTLTKFKKALTAAAALEFVAELEQKENTIVGQGGVMLSGGQRQRISLARELFKECPILILDEVTSSLDSETEREINNNLKMLKGKATVFLITHRVNQNNNINRTIMLEAGNIVS